MARSTKRGTIGVEATKHKDKRTNIPTEELRDFVAEDEDEPKTVGGALPARPVARPAARLEGQGRAGPRATWQCPAVPIYIQEKIHPQAIIENLRADGASGEREPAARPLRRLQRHAEFEPTASTSTTTTQQLVEPHDPRRLAAGDDLASPRRRA